jgi:hypothetical protein
LSANEADAPLGAAETGVAHIATHATLARILAHDRLIGL